jgi:hypothetical protein
MTQATTHKPVTIFYDSGQLKVEPPEVVLQVSKNEGAEWRKGAGVNNFDVCFGDCPFDRNYYNQDPDKNKTSAPNPDKLPRKKIFFSVYFKYSVQVGEDILDPGIVIRP